jgi:glycosyltransferase involved in cell wall biosynthesis
LNGPNDPNASNDPNGPNAPNDPNETAEFARCSACALQPSTLEAKRLIHMRRAAQPPLRVAIVAASFQILGGHAVQAQRMLDGWHADPAVRARLVPINPVPSPPFDRLLAHRFLRTIITQLWYWPLLFRELRTADVVHVFVSSYTTSFLLAPLPALTVATMLGRPVVLHHHSGEARDHLRRSAIARWAIPKLVRVNVVPSTFLRAVLASFGIPAFVVPNTIDPARFPYRRRDPLRPRLLSTRNFERHYNVGCTLRAFARIQATCPEASLTLVGSGSQERELRDLATGLTLRHVTFAGRVPHEEIPTYYADADIYVQTPSIDNMPLSVLEAFASGLPVVSTDVGGISAILTHGVHGLVAGDNDEAAIAGHVIRLLEEPAFARTLAEAAHHTCADYLWQAVRDAWLRVYDTAIESEGPTAHACVEADL